VCMGERGSVCVCMCVCMCMYACVYAYVHASRVLTGRM